MSFMQFDAIAVLLDKQLSGRFPGPFVLEALSDKGLAHWHVRLKGTGLLARIPKQSQMALAAQDNLLYQSVCFRRAAPSGHVPFLEGVIPPSDLLPRGALLVEEIVGVPASQPEHLGAIMKALAAINALPVPEPQDRAPLLDEPDPLVGLVELIDAQARYLDHPSVPAESTRVLKARLLGLTQRTAPVVRSCPQRLITFDAHPGNFLITPTGKAVLVDLEKLRYSYPPLDLAHASLYTSTTWDREASFEVSIDSVAQAHDTWAQAVGEGIAGPCRSAMVPLRELMWLWSVTWCAKWLAESGNSVRRSGDGEDWSTQHSEDELVAHVRDRVNDYLSLQTIERMVAELQALQRALTD